MTSTVFTVRLPPEVKADLERLAAATNRSKSYLAAKAIAHYIQRNAWQTKELHKALDDADNDLVVTDEAVDVWLESWGTDNELEPPRPDRGDAKPK